MKEGEKPENTQILLELKQEFSKVTGYSINTQKISHIYTAAVKISKILLGKQFYLHDNPRKNPDVKLTKVVENLYIKIIKHYCKK